jgi:NADPH2:quinone reductase
MVHAIVQRAYGTPDVLHWESVDVPLPAAGEARLEQRVIGFNLLECGMRTGDYPSPPPPFIPGVEAVGVITALGPGAGEFKVGDRVGYIGPHLGSYAQVRNYPLDRLIPLPAAIDDATAAASMIKAMTAEFLVRQSHPVKPGTRVLIHAAAGATGLMCVQLARHLGAEVFGTVSSRSKADIARANGCHHPIIYTEENFADRVLELTAGRGVDVVYDSVGRATFHDSLRALHYLGLLAQFGIASGQPPPLELMKQDLSTSYYFQRPSLFAYARTRADLLALAAAAFRDIEAGVLKVSVHARFPLRDAASAHRAAESRLTSGALLLEVS